MAATPTPPIFGNETLLLGFAEHLKLVQEYAKDTAKGVKPAAFPLGIYPGRDVAFRAEIVTLGELKVTLDVSLPPSIQDTNYFYNSRRPETKLPKAKLTTPAAKKLAQKFLQDLTFWIALDTVWWRWGKMAAPSRPNALLLDTTGNAARTFGKEVLIAALDEYLTSNNLKHRATMPTMDYESAVLLIAFIEHWHNRTVQVSRQGIKEGQAMTRMAIVASEMYDDEDRAEILREGNSAGGFRRDTPNDYEVMAVKTLDVGGLGELVEELHEWFDGNQKSVKRAKKGETFTKTVGPYVFSTGIGADGTLTCHIHVITAEKKIVMSRAFSVRGRAFDDLDSGKRSPPTLVDNSLAEQFVRAGTGTGLTVAGGDSRYHGRKGVWFYAAETIQSALKVKQKEIKTRLEALGRVVHRTAILDMTDDIQVPQATVRQKLQVIQFAFGSIDEYDEKMKHHLSLLLDRVDKEGVVSESIVLGYTMGGGKIELQVTKRSNEAYTAELAIVTRYSSEPRYYTVQQGRFVVPSYYDARMVMRQQPDYETTSATMPVGGGQSVTYGGLKSLTSRDVNALFMFVRNEAINYFVWAGLDFGARQRAHLQNYTAAIGNAKNSMIAQMLREDEIIAGEQEEERKQREERAEKRRKELAEFRKVTRAHPAEITAEEAMGAGLVIVRTIVGGRRDPMFANQFRFEYDSPGFRLTTNMLVARGAVDSKRYPLELMAYDPREKMRDGRYKGASQTRLDIEIDISPVEAAVSALRRGTEEQEREAALVFATQLQTYNDALQQRWRDWVRLVESDYAQTEGVLTAFEDSVTARMRVIELDGLHLGGR